MDLWSDAPETVSEDWLSQSEVARSLRVSVLRIGLMIANGTLDPVEHPELGAGVSGTSVERHLAWRRSASLKDRVVRGGRIALGWL